MDGVIVVVDDKMAQRVFAAIGSLRHKAVTYASVKQFVGRVCGPAGFGVIARVELGYRSGIELASDLAALGCPFPITFLDRKGVLSGCVAYLQKPVAADQLLDAIVDAAILASGLMRQSIERPMPVQHSRAAAREAA